MIKKNLEAKTNFIGVLLPSSLYSSLEEIRVTLRKTLGGKSGQTTPLHITLIPPFDRERTSEEEIVENLKKIQLKSFNVEVEGFGSFGDRRTLFAHTKSSRQWDMLYSSIFDELSPWLDIKKEKRRFTPHITLANRDINPEEIKETLLYLSELDLKTTFPLKKIALFSREGYRWIIKEENIISL